jgi:hypothetical protein
MSTMSEGASEPLPSTSILLFVSINTHLCISHPLYLSPELNNMLIKC